MHIGSLAAPLLLVALAARSGVAADPAQATPHRALEGTWLVNAAFVDTPSATFKVAFTFMPGRSAGEGTLVDSNEYQLTPNPVCTPDQGAWRKSGRGRYIATQLNFCFDATSNGAPAGLTRIRSEFVVAPDGETLGVRQYIEGFDVDGNLVFTGTVTGNGTRVQAEAPPA